MSKLKEVLVKHPTPWYVRSSTGDVLDANKVVVFGFANEDYNPKDFNKEPDPDPVFELVKFFNDNA